MLLFNDEGMISTIVQFDMQVRGDACDSRAKESSHSAADLMLTGTPVCSMCS